MEKARLAGRNLRAPVQHRGVVPHEQIPFAPHMAVNHIRPLHMGDKLPDQGLLIPRFHALDPAPVDHEVEVERLPPGDRMGANHRVRNPLVMNHPAVFERLPQLLRQPLVGPVGIHEQGIAAHGRQLLGVQEGDARRCGLIEPVCMPIIRADAARVADAADLGVFGVSQVSQVGWVDVHAPEGAAEGDLLAWTQPLASEDEELMLIQSIHDQAASRFIERAGKIEPDKLGPDRTGKPTAVSPVKNGAIRRLCHHS